MSTVVGCCEYFYAGFKLFHLNNKKFLVLFQIIIRLNKKLFFNSASLQYRMKKTIEVLLHATITLASLTDRHLATDSGVC